MLTWDDWGGYDDHVATPNVEHTPDGIQLAFGPRVPLLMFGGPVTPGIDSRWNSHVSLPNSVLNLIALTALGGARGDAPASPTSSTHQCQTAPPASAPSPSPHHRLHPGTRPAAAADPHSGSVGPIVLRDGTTLPPPNDQPITAPKHPARHRNAHLP